ncbi:MAG: hypothetical protein J1E97_05775, partial [Muribaculaceae bacterium]|nr:hypothetical protein [Muribaculaceae bacterium]
QVSMSPIEEEIPVEVILEATNTTMTHESVNIQYSIFTDIEEDNISYQLFVTGNGVDFNTTVDSASGEITVPGLKGNTAYTLEVTAQVTVSNQAYSSNAVTLEFTTPASPLVSYLGVDTSGAWPSSYNPDYPIFSENKGQSFEGTYTFQPGTSFNIWYATNVAVGDEVRNIQPFGPIDSDYDGVEEFLNFSADVTELTYTSISFAYAPARWTLQGDKELELHILFDLGTRKVVITNLTESEAPAPEVTLQPGPISQGGNENVNQSGTIDNEAKTINMQTSKAYAYVYLEGVPEGATVWYKLEDVSSITGAMLMALEGYQKAEYVEYTTDDDGNPAGDKEWRIPLASNSAGVLDVYYELANGQNTTPVTYSFMVTKTTPTGVDGINADEDGAEYFTLQGVKVQNPERGIYIRVINGKAEKVVL